MVLFAYLTCATFCGDSFHCFSPTPFIPQAIAISTYQCGSITAVFTILGSTPALANEALLTVYQSMLNGPLNGLLAVQYVALVDTPTPSTVVTTYYYYPTTWALSYAPTHSLLGLLSSPLCVCESKRDR